MAADLNAIAGEAATPVPVRGERDKASVKVVAGVLTGLLVLAAIAALAWIRLRHAAYRKPQPRVLDDVAREQMLVDVRRWIAMRPVDDVVGEVRK